MAKQRTIKFSAQSVSAPELNHVHRTPTLNSSSCRDNFVLEEEETADTKQKKLVAKLIEFLETK